MSTETNQQEVKVYILVEDGENGIRTRPFKSLEGAEAALIEAGLAYESSGNRLFTREYLEEQVLLMRIAAESNEHYGIYEHSISLWIDVCVLED